MIKSILEQTKDQIIVGSHSVTIPIKAFDIIYRDFMELKKNNLLLSDDRDLYMKQNEILLKAIKEIHADGSYTDIAADIAREALKQIGVE